MVKKYFIVTLFTTLSFLQPACGPQDAPDSSRSSGDIRSRNAEEPAPAPLVDALKHFYNSHPGLSDAISPLSSPELAVFRARPAQTRIDAILMPKDGAGQTFADFKTFDAFLKRPEHEALVKKIFLQMRLVIDGLDLAKGGYRWVFEHRDSPGQPFYFRLLGGEAMQPAMLVNKLAPVSRDAYPSSYAFIKTATASEIAEFFNEVQKAMASMPAPAGHFFRVICDTGTDANQATPHFRVDIVSGDEKMLGPSAIPKEAHRWFEGRNISEVLAHVDDKTLVVFDVDETLAWVPGHTNVSDFNGVHLAEGNQTAEMWKELLKYTSNDQAIMGAKYIALTARPQPKKDGSNDDVLANLQKINLEYSDKWITDKPGFILSSKDRKGFHNKVLYTYYGNKGKMLKEFLDAANVAGYLFEKIIFVDDRLENVTNVFNAMKGYAPIKSSISFHYRGMIHPTTGKLIHPIL